MHIEYFRKLYFLVGPIPWLSDVSLNVQNIKQLNNFTLFTWSNGSHFGYYVCSLHMNLLVMNPTPKHPPIRNGPFPPPTMSASLHPSSSIIIPAATPTNWNYTSSLHLRLFHTTVPKQIPLYNLPYIMLPPVAYSGTVLKPVPSFLPITTLHLGFQYWIPPTSKHLYSP